jgi:hypothetical protein
MEISWVDHVRNVEVLPRVKEQRNILHEIIKGKLTGLVTFCVETAFYSRLLKEGIGVKGRRRRRRRKLQDDLKKRREYSHLKEKALDRTVWRAGFERGFTPVVRQNTK